MLRISLFLALWLIAAPAAAERELPLPPELAFPLEVERTDDGARLVFNLPEGIYLYRDRTGVAAPEGTQVEQLHFPAGTIYEDEFFGESEVYFNQLILPLSLSGAAPENLSVSFQGCDDQVGICYPPETRTIGFDGLITPALAAPLATTDRAGRAAALLGGGNWLLVGATFFISGLLLSLTPCVLPMLPILLGILTQGTSPPSRRRSLSLTGAYIGGMVLTFTLAGAAAGLVGAHFAAALQQPVFILLFAGLFILLGGGLLAGLPLQLPATLRERLGKIGRGGHLGGAALMGGVSALVASPCVAAPLVGALLYIGRSGDALGGGFALMCLALGMSVLLLVVGAGAGAYLPRAGDFSATLQRLAGVGLLALAVWVGSALLPAVVEMLLYGGLLLFAGMLLHATDRLESAAGTGQRLGRALGLGLLLWGAVMLIGAASGGRDPLLPLAHLRGEQIDPLPFESIRDPQMLQDALARSAAAGRPVLLEYYADWCITCKELERWTLNDPRVKQRLAGATLLRADVTANLPEDRALLATYELFGPPALLFFAADGTWIDSVRVSGYVDADELLGLIHAAWGASG